MKASAFPRQFKVYDLDDKRMIEEKELIDRGVSMSPDGLLACSKEFLLNVIVLWATDKVDQDEKLIYEGNICKVDIQTDFGSLVVDYGVMRWNKQLGQFLLMIPSARAGQSLNVTNVKVVGHELTNPELVPLVTVTPE